MKFKGTCVKLGTWEHMPLNSIMHDAEGHSTTLKTMYGGHYVGHNALVGNVWILSNNGHISKDIKKSQVFMIA